MVSDARQPVCNCVESVSGRIRIHDCPVHEQSETVRSLGDLRFVRQWVLREAADKLDAQAEAHGEGVHDYTDLLRVWADDETRWEAGH